MSADVFETAREYFYVGKVHWSQKKANCRSHLICCITGTPSAWKKWKKKQLIKLSLACRAKVGTRPAKKLQISRIL